MGYAVGFEQVGRTSVAEVGGKGANLGELARIDGVRVPNGFCVTTEAYRKVVPGIPGLEQLLDRLSRLAPDDRARIQAVSAQVRDAIEQCPLPDDIAGEIAAAATRLGPDTPCAVRSSATAEDMPAASFAGQQDTYLNIVGAAATVDHVRRCWASLFTERAVTYRQRNGFGHSTIAMGVVVQRMVFPDASGIAMTADPITSNRKVTSVDAGFGLGEALVSGLVNADVYTVRERAILDKTIATKKVAVEAVPAGGTQVRELDAQRQHQQVLTDDQIVRLADLGRTIESHFGSPQDIEWCLAGDEFLIVQSRPITTLFPIPEATDGENHVYVSVGHQQMMTDAMKPLGISMWQLMSPAPMRTAGGRLFVDVTRMLGAPTSRANTVDALGKSDPLIGDALRTILDRTDFIRSVPDAESGPAPEGTPPVLLDADPEIVAELMAQSRAAVEELTGEIRDLSGTALLDFIETQLPLRRLSDPRSMEAITAGMEAAWWLNDRMREWLGEKNVADTLSQSVPHNVTSEMGLALLDVADAIRPHPDAVEFLQQVEDGGFEDAAFLDALAERSGGPQARAAFEGFLREYGMRCVGEIDITRPRWVESPTTLVPTILSNIKNFEAGAGERRFEQGRLEAERKAQDLLERVRTLPDGAAKAAETQRMIDRVRTFAGYREFPKYVIVVRYLIYKKALLREAQRLVGVGAIREPEDIFYLRFDELRELAHTHRPCDAVVSERKREFRAHQALSAPRVLTSEGEALAGAYRREDVPAGALAGLPVSSGTVEGRARVVSDISQADFDPGDILVTAYTDPSWTPLFVAIAGLVTEVGGLMTHGAVIAREYGLPAVVGVENATRLIEDGQRIRVHGTDGYVELL